MKVYSCEISYDGFHSIFLSSIDELNLSEQVGKTVETLLKLRPPTSSWSSIQVKNFNIYEMKFP